MTEDNRPGGMALSVPRFLSSIFCLLSTVFCLLALTGCGFQPLYGQRSSPAGVANQLGGIEVGQIDSRSGQQLRNHLIDRFSARTRMHDRPYRLEVVLTESQQGLAIRSDDAVTRYNYRLIANFRLLRTTDQQVIFEDAAYSSAAFNVVQSEFATLSAARDAESRASRALGDDISTRLALYFQRQNS